MTPKVNRSFEDRLAKALQSRCAEHPEKMAVSFDPALMSYLILWFVDVWIQNVLS